MFQSLSAVTFCCAFLDIKPVQVGLMEHSTNQNVAGSNPAGRAILLPVKPTKC